MTCNEIAKNERAGKNEKDYIFEFFKKEYPIYQEKYKEGLITCEELLEWLECMKIRK